MQRDTLPAPTFPARLLRALRSVHAGTWRALAWGLGIAYFVVAVALLSLRYAVLPQVGSHRGDIAREISRALSLQVEIDRLEARWAGARPHLDLSGVTVFDQQGRPALRLGRVAASLSWKSLLVFGLRLDRCEILAPDLAIRRDPAGRLFVAGIEIKSDGRKGGLGDWLLQQDEVVIRDARLEWHDELRAAPPLVLTHLDFRLVNGGSHHRFALAADPPPEWASRLDVRGDLRGTSFERLDDWRGTTYVRVDHADLAVWRQWVDYPADVPRGSGALRAWADFDGRQLTALVADVALQDVSARLGAELPRLELASLEGRVHARLRSGALEFGGRQLALATADGIRLPPSHFLLRWNGATARSPARGELSVAAADLAVLSRLSRHLPLPEEARRLVADYAPRGQVLDLRSSWSGAERLERYSLRARVRNAGINAQGVLPGFEGISAVVDADQDGGSAVFNAREGLLDLPRVFPESRIPLDGLAAQVKWTVRDGEADVQLEQVSFANRDAAGSLSGRYRSARGGPGSIDLTGRLTRADGTAVWRYLPKVVSERVRRWLEPAVTAGTADDVRLRLKGDLRGFPWPGNRDGHFQVSARLHGATLHYGPDWPPITQIAGSLLFEGERMEIRASEGRVLGNLRVYDVLALIPDLNARGQQQLVVTGKAVGATPDFLRFVAASGLPERVRNFTRDIGATGNGSLDLRLDMPLRQVADTRVQGEYRFAHNEVAAQPGLPVFADAAGRLRFTERGLDVEQAAATFLGGPLTLAARTGADGAFQLTAQGTATAAGLRGGTGLPLFDRLEGSTAWRGTLELKGGSALLNVDSSLQGLASRLPAPFAKAAGTALPLRLELRGSEAAGPRREELRASLGNLLSAQWLRRREGGRMVLERGAVALQDRLALPEQGIAVMGRLARLDLDPWRRLLATDDGEGEPGEPLPPIGIELRADELISFQQRFSDVELSAGRSGAAWNARVKSRELAGDLVWSGAGQGRLQARLQTLALAEVKAEPAAAAEPAEAVRRLPALDVVAESFSLRGKALGRLELQAVNQGRQWRIDHLSLANPDGSLAATGQWRLPGPGSGGTDLSFRLESADAGKLLARLGYGEALRRGTATLEGKLAWGGPPTAIDLPTLSGAFTLEAARGQFAKLEPGFGRLLGVLSLQALPRRIGLDFRDVFSDGFAFDSVSGSMKVDRGVISTDNLLIRGPSARVLMTGSASVPAETQDLRVRVQPTLSESVALGAALANPLAGVAALVAQKIFRDPIEQMFAYQYAITGSWADPKVEKLQQPVAQPAGPEEGLPPTPAQER